VPYGGADTWSKVLVASHFELYGTLSPTPNGNSSITPPQPFTLSTQPKVQLTVPGIYRFRFQTTDDNNGLVYSI
jgi:hypothetical protein